VKHHIEGYQLLEADGGGVRDIEVAIVATEDAAKQWKGGNFYRSYRFVSYDIHVHDSYEALQAFQARQTALEAMRKLTKEERLALNLPAEVPSA
jgi:hypothetical protein